MNSQSLKKGWRKSPDRWTEVRLGHPGEDAPWTGQWGRLPGRGGLWATSSLCGAGWDWSWVTAGKGRISQGMKEKVLSWNTLKSLPDSVPGKSWGVKQAGRRELLKFTFWHISCASLTVRQVMFYLTWDLLLAYSSHRSYNEMWNGGE